MKNLLLLFVIYGLIGILGCKKEAVEHETKNDKISVESRSIMSVRQAFASTLLTSIQNVSALQTFIYNKIQKADTSVYELVYLAVKDEVISNGNTFADIMNNYASSQVVSDYGSNYFSTITDDQPLLSISMSDFSGLDVSNWQASTIPDVFALSATVDNKITKYSTSLSSPQSYIVKQSTDPSTIVTKYSLAITKAEGYYLINSNGQSLGSAAISEYLPSTGDATKDATDRNNLLTAINSGNYNQYTINGASYYLIGHNELLKDFVSILGSDPYFNPYFPDIEGYIVACPDCVTPPPPPPACVSECERDCEDEDEHLVAFRLQSTHGTNPWDVLKYIDNQGPFGWFESRFVFNAVILLAPIKNGNVEKFTPKYVSPEYRKGDLLECHPCEGIWKYPYYRIWTDWKKDELGNPYAISWYEVDPGNTTFNFSVPLSVEFPIAPGVKGSVGLEFGFSIQGDKIVDLGNQRVFYCDDILKINRTGSIAFKCD